MKNFYNIFLILIIGLAAAIAVTAFTNPPGNPPTGGGALGVGSNAPASSLYIASSTGYVGIGTTAPGDLLDVSGSSNGILGARVINTNTGVSASAALRYKNSGTTSAYTGLSGSGRVTYATLGANIMVAGYTDSTAGITTLVDAAGPITFGTNALERVRIDSSGNVGIGTASPGARLDIEGGNLDLSGNNITGVNKISVNTIDPIFKINGQKYVTYVPDSLGQKVEVAGAAQLVNGEWSIDLAEQTSNPDLWLFYQIIKPESIIPFVSSQSPASLYAFFDGSKLVVKLKDGDSQARFSYRLMADRIDSQGSNYLLPETEANEVYIDVDLWKK